MFYIKWGWMGWGGIGWGDKLTSQFTQIVYNNQITSYRRVIVLGSRPNQKNTDTSNPKASVDVDRPQIPWMDLFLKWFHVRPIIQIRSHLATWRRFLQYQWLLDFYLVREWPRVNSLFPSQRADVFLLLAWTRWWINARVAGYLQHDTHVVSL